MAQKLNPQQWRTEFGQDASDGIVPVNSQLNGQGSLLLLFPGVHSRGTAALGFGPPTDLEPDSGVPDAIADLLNKRTDDINFH